MTHSRHDLKPSESELRDLALDELSYGLGGLIPAIVQDQDTLEVLMLAWMDEEALRRTMQTQTTWFYSRSRKTYWNKGEQSGNTQEVVSVHYDCDGDTLLVKVHQRGDGLACHTGARSCFYRTIKGKD